MNGSRRVAPSLSHVFMNSLEVLDLGILISTTCKTGLNTLHPWDNQDSSVSHFGDQTDHNVCLTHTNVKSLACPLDMTAQGWTEVHSDSILAYIAKQSPQYRP